VNSIPGPFQSISTLTLHPFPRSEFVELTTTINSSILPQSDDQLRQPSVANPTNSTATSITSPTPSDDAYTLNFALLIRRLALEVNKFWTSETSGRVDVILFHVFANNLLR
jgi:hypothetical protein